MIDDSSIGGPTMAGVDRIVSRVPTTGPTTPLVAWERSRIRDALLVGLAFALAAFLCRISNVGSAFENGLPRLNPFDDLYHAKRIIYVVKHFPSILDFDPDRGVNGAWCPWPPLYDWVAGGLAKALGKRTDAEILCFVSWLPPISGAVLTGAVAAVVAVWYGRLTALLAGAGLALNPLLIKYSQVGQIDHHFLEPAVVLTLAGVLLLVRKAHSTRTVLWYGAIFGITLTAALFVQIAFLLAAGVMLGCLIFVEGNDIAVRAAGAFGFAISGLLIISYRLTRPPHYSDDPWHLGFIHAEVLAAAAVSCATLAWSLWRKLAVPAASCLALIVGCACLAAAPGGLEKALGGGTFLGGNTWLREVAECQPMFFGASRIPGHAISRVRWEDARLLGGSALLLFPFTISAIRHRLMNRLSFGIFTWALLIIAVSSMRFAQLVAPLHAIAGAIVAAEYLTRRRPLVGSFLTVVCLGPSIIASALLLRHPPPEDGQELQAYRVARVLGGLHPLQARVLAPWPWGHAIDVVAQHPVVADGFGETSGISDTFQQALVVLLSTREAVVADYCRKTGVRFIVLESPVVGIPRAVVQAGLPVENYFRTVAPPDVFMIGRLTQSTFWWRAYSDGGQARQAAGVRGRQFRFFRRVYAEGGCWQPSATSPDGPVQVWEFDPSIKSAD